MGFDCTLHAIDERALEAFAKRLVGMSRDDAFAEVRRLATDGDAERAGHAVTELALYHASASGPHLAARGIALSLWDEELLGEAPWKLTGSVEKGPLRSVVGRWRRLARKLPLSFDGNECTGVFVPAKHVPALLAEVERRFAARPKGATRRWEPLRRILRVAARHRLAYWEATDLAVQSGHPEWLAEAEPQGEAGLCVGKPVFDGGPDLIACDGDTAVVSSHAVFRTWVVDLRRWPFRVAAHRGLFTYHAAIAPSGRIVLFASDDAEAHPRPFRLYELAGAGAKPRLLSPMVLEGVSDVGVAGETPILSPYRAGERPWRLRRDRLEPLPLPAAVGYRQGRHRAIGFGTTRFSDGTPLVIWDGSPYRVEGTRFVRLAKGDLRPESGLSCAPLDDEHAVVTRERRLVLVSRAGKLTRRFARADNVMIVVPGPRGAVLLGEGDNDDGHLAKLWWPHERAWVGVEPEELGLEDASWVSWALWAREPALLVACDGTQLRALAGVDTRPRAPER